MAICKRSATAVFHGADPVKKMRAKRTIPCTIKKPVFVSTEDYEETAYLGEGTYAAAELRRKIWAGQTSAQLVVRRWL